MIDREKMGNFDLGRLTPAGWLVGLFSVAGGMAIGISVGFALKAEFQGPNGQSPKWTVTLGGVLGFACIVALFKLLQMLLGKTGITVIRPEKSHSIATPEQGQGSAELNSIAENSVHEEVPEIQGATLPLNRLTQVIIGLILLSLGGVLALLAQLPDMPRNPRMLQGAAALAGLMGLASIFTWGRPYTLRAVFGLFSLAMLWMMVGCFFDAKPDFKAGVFAAMIGLASGAYAIIGKVPDWGGVTGRMGLQTPERRLKLTNTTDHLQLVVTEPGSRKYWLNPGETVELRAYVQSSDATFDVRDDNQGVVVYPSQGMGSIKVYSGDHLLSEGYQKPQGQW